MEKFYWQYVREKSGGKFQFDKPPTVFFYDVKCFEVYFSDGKLKQYRYKPNSQGNIDYYSEPVLEDVVPGKSYGYVVDSKFNLYVFPEDKSVNEEASVFEIKKKIDDETKLLSEKEPLSDFGREQVANFFVIQWFFSFPEISKYGCVKDYVVDRFVNLHDRKTFLSISSDVKDYIMNFLSSKFWRDDFEKKIKILDGIINSVCKQGTSNEKSTSNEIMKSIECDQVLSKIKSEVDHFSNGLLREVTANTDKNLTVSFNKVCRAYNEKVKRNLAILTMPYMGHLTFGVYQHFIVQEGWREFNSLRLSSDEEAEFGKCDNIGKMDLLHKKINNNLSDYMDEFRSKYSKKILPEIFSEECFIRDEISKCKAELEGKKIGYVDLSESEVDDMKSLESKIQELNRKAKNLNVKLKKQKMYGKGEGNSELRENESVLVKEAFVYAAGNLIFSNCKRKISLSRENIRLLAGSGHYQPFCEKGYGSMDQALAMKQQIFELFKENRLINGVFSDGEGDDVIFLEDFFNDRFSFENKDENTKYKLGKTGETTIEFMDRTMRMYGMS